MDTVPSLRTGKVIQVTQLNIYSAKLLKTKVMKQLNEMKKFLSKGAKTEKPKQCHFGTINKFSTARKRRKKQMSGLMFLPNVNTDYLLVGFVVFFYFNLCNVLDLLTV